MAISSNRVSREWVVRQLNQNAGGFSIADVRFHPDDPDYGHRVYRENHLPGAVFVDLKRDLTDPAGTHGGRSPLPSVERLADLFGRLGFERSKPIVVYDDDLRPEAARLWWILRYLGHEQVYILEGGYSGWAAAGLPVTEAETNPAPASFVPEVQAERLADVETVRTAVARGTAALVDSRDRRQFLGEAAPYDPVAGRIPGAVHAFWKDGVNEEGGWKSPEAQRLRFSLLDQEQDVIVYCGSGLSACPNVLALEEAGFRRVKLYAGSWSDWISYADHPVATGEE
ncbi:sulfurtransferase [Paenibacillus aurantius]|uniref:Sulfurtransferase n=1 Tax=Paenibacillus aurantius TaxID=2918900 RepID=A0AA96LCF6_9BACL|nr:sulfurtransferase [Paenibacillus aurantius]WNQ11106.1 sulfurtransferase [Paenibacillus aurantius]